MIAMSSWARTGNKIRLSINDFNYPKKMNSLKLFCVLCLIGGKVMAIPNDTTEVHFSVDTTIIKLPEADYKVKKIIREKNNLYVIDLERSDSVFRIFSHYDGTRNSGDVKLHKHDKVKVELIIPSEFVRRRILGIMNPLDVGGIKHYGVDITNYIYRNTFRFPYYFEIRYCDDLNGRYLRPKKD